MEKNLILLTLLQIEDLKKQQKEIKLKVKKRKKLLRQVLSQVNLNCLPQEENN